MATVTEEPRLRMRWRGRTIADLSREFLASNGAEKHARVSVPVTFVEDRSPALSGTLDEKLRTLMSDLSTCSRRGLGGRFDSTIGAGTVVMPYGGRRQLTPMQSMIAKLPVPERQRPVPPWPTVLSLVSRSRARISARILPLSRARRGWWPRAWGTSTYT